MYLTKDSKYLLNNVSSLFIEGYLRHNNEFKITVMLDKPMTITQMNLDRVKTEIINEVPMIWKDRVGIYGTDIDEDKMTFIIVKFKK